MRIVESQVVLQASHVRENKQTLSLQRSESFQSVYASSRREQGTELEARARQMLVGLLEAILAALTGRKCREITVDCRQEPVAAPVRERRIDWQLDIHESEYERECTTVSGAGCIRTADGKQLEFDWALLMERARTSERNYRESGHYVLHDPLVLNFSGAACDLAGARLDFDLDADGKTESLPGLGESSAYLVLDCNGNGRADDGNELFGSQSGDGFADLTQYDSDRNGWIDEADPVFARLSLWRGGQPNTALQSLSDAGVGAIWLGSVASPFAEKSAANELLGEIRASGLWLGENGQAGSVQQVDLAVGKPT